VKSRAGLEQQADLLINSATNLLSHQPSNQIHCVLVDECQFLDPKHIDQLREITYAWNVPVICYGLRTDFRTHLFPASQR
jgi:thymidine kinase